MAAIGSYRQLFPADGSSSSGRKRVVTVTKVEKWILKCDRALNTATWLVYEKADI